MRLHDDIQLLIDNAIPEMDPDELQTNDDFEDLGYRNALGSMALAMQGAGIDRVVILECVATACDAYGNNRC